MIYRQIQPKDLDQVVGLAYVSFMKGYYDVPEEELRIGTHNYVVEEIRDSTFVEVCEEDGKILGFMMGYVVGKEKAFSKSDYSLHSKRSKEFAIIGETINKCNKRMKSSCPTEVDCEGTLLAIDPDARGKGIGTRLFDDIIKHFKENGCKSMYLFTGDNCTMQYYEHRREYVLAGKEMLDIGSRVRDSRMYTRSL